MISGHTVIEEKCGDGCRKVNLNRLLDSESETKYHIADRHLSTYIADLDQKINSLVKNFIKCSSFELFSRYFNFHVVFSSSGTGKVVGIIWPLIFEELNKDEFEDQAKKDHSSKQILESVDKMFTSTSSKEILKEKFNLSDDDGASVVKLVNKYQYHHCQEEGCKRCASVPLPSITAMQRSYSESEDNILTISEFVKSLKGFLHDLSTDEVDRMSTIDWLSAIWEDKVVESSALGPRKWKIVLSSKTFTFILEDALIKFIKIYEENCFFAFYQFALACTANEAFVISRPFVKNSFTQPYNPTLLLAAQNEVETSLLSGDDQWKALFYKNEECCVEMNLPGHSMISLAEGVSLMDHHRLKPVTSQASVFVNCSRDAKPLFKKVRQVSPNTYHIEGRDGEIYELQNTLVSRYFLRRNGMALLLAEVAVHYEYAGEEKSAEEVKIFGDHIDRIPNSQDSSIINNEPLPGSVKIS